MLPDKAWKPVAEGQKQGSGRQSGGDIRDSIRTGCQAEIGPSPLGNGELAER